MSEPILSHPDRTSEPILSHPRSCYPKSFPSPDARPIFPLIFQSIFILEINITSTRLRSKVWPTTRKRQKRQPATPSRQRRLPPSGVMKPAYDKHFPSPLPKQEAYTFPILLRLLPSNIHSPSHQPAMA